MLINLSHEDIDSEYDLEGYDCIGADGEKLGDVDGVVIEAETMQPRYVIVDAGGWLSSRRFLVPAGEVCAIEDDAHEVHFRALTKELLESGRYTRYDESWLERQDTATLSAHEHNGAHVHESAWSGRARADHAPSLSQRPAAGAARLELAEERLRTGTQREHAGSVRLGKRLVGHTERVNVPVREERVVIERTPVAEARAGTIATGETVIEVPLIKERVRLVKEPVVREAVTARKETVTHTAQVEATVRKEELAVDVDGDLAARNLPDHQP